MAESEIEIQSRIDNAFELAKDLLPKKAPADGKRFTKDEKTRLVSMALEEVVQAIDAASVMKPEEIKTLVLGNDAARYGEKALSFIRPNAKQIQTGLDWGWELGDAIKGYTIGENGDCSKGELSVMKIDDMKLFDSDEEAAKQAEKDGVKLIPKKELHFARDNDMRHYRYIDTPKNRKLLSDFIVKTKEKEIEKSEGFQKDSAKLFIDKETGNKMLVYLNESPYEWNGWPTASLFSSENKLITTHVADAENLENAASDFAADLKNDGLWGNEKLEETKDETQIKLLKHNADDWEKEREKESFADFNGEILASHFETLCIKPEICSYLINKEHASIKNALYIAAGDAFLGDNLRWLIENGPEDQWHEIRADKKFCEEVLTNAENSIRNDSEYSINPTLELAKKLGMPQHALSFCKKLYEEIPSESTKKRQDFIAKIDAFKAEEEKHVVKAFLEKTKIQADKMNPQQEDKIFYAVAFARKSFSPEEQTFISSFLSKSGAKNGKELSAFLKKQIESEKQIQKNKKLHKKSADDDFSR